MFSEGNILYFTPFYFRNQGQPKPKFFVVLKVLGEKSILASLPTSKDHIPAKNVIEYGCIEMPEINLNCFVFSSNVPVTTCGKSFDVPTFIYGAQLDTFDIADMQCNYVIEGVDYVRWGVMLPDIFQKLLLCLKNSKAIKMKYLRMLNGK